MGPGAALKAEPEENQPAFAVVDPGGVSALDGPVADYRA